MSSAKPMKTVLVTGCTPGGIGYALAKEFQARGCRVIATGRRPAVLEELASSGFDALRLDVTDAESIAAAKKQVETITGGKLDILVNNAGTTFTRPLAEVPLDMARSLFEANLFSVMAMTTAMLPFLVAAQGLVVNISSASDRLPFPFKGTYGMTKAALTSYSRTLSVELAELGVRVCNVVTAFIDTQLGKPPADDPAAAEAAAAAAFPDGSLWRPLRDVGTKVAENGRMSAEQYARHVVAQCLRGKGWDLLGWRFGGTPETIRYGTLGTPLWILGVLGDGWGRYVMLRMYPFRRLRGQAQQLKQKAV